ncbi:MAG: flavodoxin domain-containing protein [Alphaproteobacteria bacterium]|nr:flavodoxin domain-containing protein [Alphaproteobacteria bacterium]
MITIFVGTMTGTAELCADEMADALQARGVETEIRLMDGLDETALAAPGDVIICSSTYGQGDVPDNAQAFIEALQTAKPDLSGVRFGLFALGDMTYAQTFCFGGKQFDETLSALGAQRVGEVHRHDASGGTLPEDEAGEWAAEWANLLTQSAESVAA